MIKATQFFTDEYLESCKKMTPTQIAKFLDDYRSIIAANESERILISMRVPKNLLELFKTKARLRGYKYQSKIIELMNAWVKGAT